MNTVNSLSLRLVSRWDLAHIMACIFTKNWCSSFCVSKNCPLEWAITLSYPSSSVWQSIAPRPPLISPVPVEASTIRELSLHFLKKFMIGSETREFFKDLKTSIQFSGRSPPFQFTFLDVSLFRGHSIIIMQIINKELYYL